MNIDVVNSKVSKKLEIDEKIVALVNKYYWNRIKEHIISYNPNPVNIYNIAVIYPSKNLIKRQILSIIKKLRELLNSETRSDEVKKRIIDKEREKLRNLLKIRKHNKFTN